MIKVQNTNNTITKEKHSELKRHYTISVIKRENGFQARVTLKIIEDGKNPRLTSYSAVSVSESVCKVLEKMYERLAEYKSMNFLKQNICLKIYDAIMISIRNLQLTNDTKVMESATVVFRILTSINSNVISTISVYTNNISNAQNFMPNGNVYQPIQQQNNLGFFEHNQIKPITSKSFKEVAIEWFEYKKSLIVQTTDNPKPLSPKTVQGYNDTLTAIIIPYFEKNENISFITENKIKEFIDKVNGYRTKECIYIVLKMIFDYAREHNYIFYVPRIKKPSKPFTDKEQTIIFIESDRHDLWLNSFEKENTDVSLLFETMLLTGARPEEACGLKWCAINEFSNELIINNAYKDYPIYNGTKVIGHNRSDGRLKTPESYRRIPLNPRLKSRLLEHKEKQKQLFKLYKMKWDENCYMFLNHYRQPYVSENLSKSMKVFIQKYNLEYMTVYGLRHSFATFCSEEGMEEIVLMKLMGHADFNTTQKYYIVVSSKRKKQAMQQVYKNIFEKECRNQVIA